MLLLPILILLVTPLTMLILQRRRPQFSYHWLVAAGGGLAAWLVVMFLQGGFPDTIRLIYWRPERLFSSSPVLLLDSVSWPLAAAVATLGLAAILTDVGRATEADWTAWAGVLALEAMGILAVLAGNPLTLLLAWFLIDLLDLVILLLRSREYDYRRGAAIYFGTSLVGIMVMVWAQVVARTSGTAWTFEGVPPEAATLAILAVGLRLGVLPLHQPLLKEPPLRRGLGSMLRLTLASVSLVVLARMGAFGVSARALPYLLGLTYVAAIYGGVKWVSAEDEISGRPYWVLAVTGLAVAAALQGETQGALAWSLSLVYVGGLLFLASTRPRTHAPLFIVGLLHFSTLPFSGAQAAADTYGRFDPLFAGFLGVQGLLIYGYARHALRGGEGLVGVERWVQVIYPIGLVILPLTQFASAWWLSSDFVGEATATPWWPGGAALVIAGLGGLLHWLGRGVPRGILNAFEVLFSLNWFYRLMGRVYRGVGGGVAFINRLLEGEAGVLWALLLVALLLSLLAQLGVQAGG